MADPLIFSLADLLALADLLEHVNRVLGSEQNAGEALIACAPPEPDTYAVCTISCDDDALAGLEVLLFEGRLYLPDDIGPVPVRPFVAQHVTGPQLRLGWAVCHDEVWMDDDPPRRLPRRLIPRRRGA